MRAKITLPDSELKKFNRSLQKKTEQITDRASIILVDETLKAHGMMRQNINSPGKRGTGRSRAATLFNFKRAGNAVREAIIGTYVNYAIYVERYKPYFKPAIDRMVSNLNNRFQNLNK